MEVLITLLALPIAFLSALAGGGCTYQDELISVVEQDTTMTQEVKDSFISRVKNRYPECFIKKS